MFCICFIIIIIIIDLIFIDFCLEICQWHLNVRFLPPISYVPMIAVLKTVVSKSGNPGPGPVPNSYFLYYIFIKALILIKLNIMHKIMYFITFFKQI